MRIVLPGGSGQVGQMLARHFHSRGDSVVVLSRRPASTPWTVVPWDGETLGDWRAAFEAADVVVNLAGRSVNCRYNAANRREILESRVRSTSAVGEAIARCSRPPRIWMNASTATIYRHSFEPMNERTGELGGKEPDTPGTWRFSVEVAQAWEREFFSAPTPGTRKIALRSAMTMSPDPGGVFDVLLGLVRKGLGGANGSGRQFVSWIHDLDFLRAIDFLIEYEELDGVVNLASPNPLPNGDFMRALRHAAGVPFGLPASEWMLEIGAVFLRTETELILKSRRVVPTRLLENGFDFRFPDWPDAARDLVTRRRLAAL
ncbi:MAG: TIGR01777 family oxidoreductase [Bryobacteraceae bacterium]|nr:TIGR01777 family oxidoreductase [Bryobacteraceae bacterium]